MANTGEEEENSRFTNSHRYQENGSSTTAATQNGNPDTERQQHKPRRRNRLPSAIETFPITWFVSLYITVYIYVSPMLLPHTHTQNK
jgi:hypothetical protein